MFSGQAQTFVFLVSASLMPLLTPERYLPQAIRQDLTRQLGKWHLVAVTRPDGKTEPPIITGDFDGNGQIDYAVYLKSEKGLSDRQQQLIIYLNRGGRYRRHTLLRQSATTDTWPYLFKKGQSDYRYDRGKNFRYEYDTIGHFSEKGGVSYLYRKGRFYPVITSD